MHEIFIYLKFKSQTKARRVLHWYLSFCPYRKEECHLILTQTHKFNQNPKILKLHKRNPWKHISHKQTITNSLEKNK